MHLARAALRASATRSLQHHGAVARLGQPLHHDFSVLASVKWDPEKSQFAANHPSQSNLNRPQSLPQVRFRRHDRSSAFSKPRPKTKKQRQVYNRKMKKLDDATSKHNAPGSRAGPRRQWVKERKQQLLAHGTENDLVTEDDEYGLEDALMEDILGNTSHLSSQPTPEPVYLGHLHKKFYNRVADQMDLYREAIDRQSNNNDNNNHSHSEGTQDELLDVSSVAAELPSDKIVSDVLRAYRDRHGTRSKPIGIVTALQHLLKDLGVPTLAFGEYTYTSLLTCCRTPKEARRIFKLINDHQLPISAYSWSILVDIHAKLGDFEGCGQIIQEMASAGVAPTQAAYTSLLAACHKVCNDGRIPHAIRAKAGKLGWRQWQEMRIVGIEPDAMAYGAIIRLCAARGQAERALNLLEEMYRFDVKPTTLCFSSALRAVARSHEIGIRYERGSSRKQLRRESIAAHHGKMARQIVILAESAEIHQDEGFVSALMLCAGAAGDSATAKAVYLAAEVRKMDHLRTIGSDMHLKQLRGEAQEDSSSERGELSGENTLALGDGVDSESPTEDTARSIDGGALVNASGQESSIRVGNNSQGGVIPQERKSFGEREYGKDTRSLSALLRSCAQATNGNGVGTIWAGRQNQGYLCENSLRLITTRWQPSYRDTSIPGVNSTKAGIGALRRYDEDERDEQKKGGARKKFRGMFVDEDAALTIDDLDHDVGDEFDDNSDKFKLRAEPLHDDPRMESQLPESKRISHAGDFTSARNESLEHLDICTENIYDDTAQKDEQPSKNVDEEGFEMFYAELREEASQNGVEDEVSKDDARELYIMMRGEFASALENGGVQDLLDSAFDISDSGVSVDDDVDDTESVTETEQMLSEVVFESEDLGHAAREMNDTIENIIDDFLPVDVPEASNSLPSSSGLSSAVLSVLDPEELERMLELQSALPGLPLSRLKKILKTFDTSLGYPSILTLVPILRETLPDYITSGWLKRTNMRNAEFVLQKTSEDGSIDVGLLNSMLQVKTNVASLDAAVKFHRDQFRRHNMRPNGYSDRLVLQMLVDNNRLQRALAFKQQVEEESRTLDIPSYGSLVDYYAKHSQLGSALMILKECISLHGSPPSEKCLSKLRLICRQQNVGEDVHLVNLIGEDPIEWLRHGETHFKRDMSKKGRRDVQWAQNRILQA